MRRLRLLFWSLVGLTLIASCTDTPIAPDQSRPGPRLSVSATATAGPISFCNPATITIREANRALPYPSTVTVTGAPAAPFKITVTLMGISHPTLTDLDVLLVGPANQNVMLMSDAGGAADLQSATLTFDDDASTQIPAESGDALPSGSYKPTNVGSLDFMAGPAPAEPYGSTLAVFIGTDPYGTWSLYIQDDILSNGGGSVAGGWCVNIVPNSPPVANAGGPYSGTKGLPINFDGTGSTDPDGNIVSYAWDFGDGGSGTGATVEHTYATSGTYTVTLVVTDDDGATDDATALVTVPHVAPTATFDAPTEVSEGSVATISLTSPSAADARYAFDCGGGYGPIGTMPTAICRPADNGTLTVKAKIVDAAMDDLFTEYTGEINVTNVAPIATFANNGPVDEGTSIQIQLTNPVDVAADLAAGLTYAFDCGSGYAASGTANSASCPTADNGDLQVKGKVIDKDGGETQYVATVIVRNVAPVVTSLALPLDPIAANTPVMLAATFTDVGTGDTHTGVFELGTGGPIVSGSIVETNGSGSMSASISFSESGVYTIIARVTDDDGGVGSRSSAMEIFVVVYDPSTSFATGGGWINSPAGAYVAEPALTGRASFGFVVKYAPGTSTPIGNTEFRFQAGDFAFKSTSYDRLVLAAVHARYTGEGTINGGGRYGFALTAVDGDRKTTRSPDEFRIRIWNLSSGAIVYDNRMGEAEDSPSGTTLGGGSIVIHK
jgi:PKD repeat protein